MATSIIREDGTGDYTSLAAWEAGEQRDLVTAADGERAEIQGAWTNPESRVAIDGWTTDATYYIEVEAVGDARHTGQWTSTAYRVSEPSGNAAAFDVFEEYTRVTGIQSESGSGVVPTYADVGNCIVDSCIFRNHYLLCHMAGGSIYRNVLVYDTVADFSARVRSSNNTFQNCTFIGGTHGINHQTGSGITVQNCVAYGQSTAGFDLNTPVTGDFNASEDGTGPGANSITLLVDPFEDAANDDYSPASGSALLDAGDDLSADFTTDIAGTSRPQGSAWDIGAVELVSAGGPEPVDLVLEDALHGHTADSVVLTQGYVLTPDSALHGQAVDEVEFTQDHVLSADDAAHEHEADSITLVQAQVLAVQGALHSQLADGVALSQSLIMAPDDTGHFHSVDVLDLIQANQISVDDASHTHEAESVVLTLSSLLEAADSIHGHVSDSVALTQGNILAVASGYHNHSVDAVLLSQAHQLSVQDAVHSHLAGSVSLSLALTMEVAGALHAQSADGLVLTQEGVFAPHDAIHGHLASGIILTQANILEVLGALHGLTSDVPLLTLIANPIATIIVSDRPYVVMSLSHSKVVDVS